ncbi:MAG: hypothetical protein HN368_09555 [Spirochaetales bacterium]|jgi:hypothetical protein|nr:hypothetical protein [Spirochaetales bacterium]
MPTSVEIRDNIVEILWSGTFAAGEVSESLIAIKDNLAEGQNISILIKDQVQVFHFDSAEARLIAALLKEMKARGVKKTCMVVNKPVHYGIGRMISAYCDLVSVIFEIFWEEDKARAWLQSDQGALE